MQKPCYYCTKFQLVCLGNLWFSISAKGAKILVFIPSILTPNILLPTIVLAQQKSKKVYFLNSADSTNILS